MRDNGIPKTLKSTVNYVISMTATFKNWYIFGSKQTPLSSHLILLKAQDNMSRKTFREQLKL